MEDMELGIYKIKDLISDIYNVQQINIDDEFIRTKINGLVESFNNSHNSKYDFCSIQMYKTNETINVESLTIIRDSLWKKIDRYNSNKITLIQENNNETCISSLIRYCCDNPLTFIDLVKSYKCNNDLDINITTNIILIFNTLKSNVNNTINGKNSIVKLADYFLNFVYCEIMVIKND